MGELQGSQNGRGSGQRGSVGGMAFRHAPERQSAPPSKQRGVSMAVVVMGLAIAGVVTILAVNTFNTLMGSTVARAAGDELTTIVTAAGNYFLSRRGTYVGFDPALHAGVDFPGNRNVLGDHLCGGAAPANCTNVNVPAAAGTATALELVYDGFESETQCQTALAAIRNLSYVNETLTVCGAHSTPAVVALDLSLDNLRD